MAPKFFFTSSSIILLLFYVCHAHDSLNNENLPLAHYFMRNMNGTQKGELREGIRVLKKYLANLGYIESSTTPFHRNDDFFDDTLESAIKKYQQFYNLKITGILDQETVELLSRPRCGVPDFHSNANLSSFLHNVTNMGSFYTIDPGVRWYQKQLFFSYPKFVPDDAHIHIVRSMIKWMRATPFEFVWTDDLGIADIKISFERGDHGDGLPFDGPNGVLAHTFSPSTSLIHFDADEKWRTDAHPGENDLQSVALHELGHALGLLHSQDRNAVMYAYLAAGKTKRELTDDDIQGIRALYPDYQNPPAP